MNHSGAVAVTGASGYIGAQLIKKMAGHPQVKEIVAVDKAPSPSGCPAITYRQDLTQPITPLLQHHEAATLVHLAFIIRPGHNQREIMAIQQTNLNMLNTVLDSCAEAGVKHVIYLSSHTVYGAHPDNPVPLTEEAPLRPLPGFPYGYTKLISEALLKEFSRNHPGVKVTILRSCVVVGPNSNNYITRAFFRPLLLGISGYNPGLQFIHQDDLARILARVIEARIPGVFNVAGEGAVPYREMADMIGSKLVTLPASFAYPLTQLSWMLRLQSDSSPAGLDFIRYPIFMSTKRLKKGAGYRFMHTSREALRAFAKAKVGRLD